MLDDNRPGRLTTTVTLGNTKLVKELLDYDRRFTMISISEKLGLSFYTVQYLKISRRLMKKHFHNVHLKTTYNAIAGQRQLKSDVA